MRLIWELPDTNYVQMLCYDFKVSMSWLSLYSVATARASLLAFILTSSSATRWIADLTGERGREGEGKGEGKGERKGGRDQFSAM